MIEHRSVSLAVVTCSVLFLAASFSGCQGTDAPEARNEVLEVSSFPATTSPAEQDSARALLSRARPALIDSAFARLQEQPHNLLQRTTQFDQEGQEIAVALRELRVSPQNNQLTTEVTREEIEGTFDFGVVNRFMTRPPIDEAALEPPQGFIPEDPGYLSQRNFENYAYRLIADTTVNGQRAIGAEAVLRADADDQPNERYALVLLTPDTHDLLHYSGLLARETLLFHERTRSTWSMTTRRNEERRFLLPSSTSVHTRLHLPFTRPREVRIETDYRTIEPLNDR